MASALEQLTQGTTAENPVSFKDYYNAYGRDTYGSSWGPYDVDPNDLAGRIQNFFAGTTNSAKQQYDLYLTKLQNEYTARREDTAIRRQMADAKAAGLNPLALLTGNVPSGASSSAAAEFSKSSGSKSSKASNLVTSALKLLAILALKG